MAPVPGWYPDPAGMAELRYWDGQHWTTATTSAFASPQAPPTAAPAPTPTVTPAWATAQGRHRGPSRSRRLWAAVVAAVAIITLIAAGVPWLFNDDGEVGTRPSATTLKAALLTPADVSRQLSTSFSEEPQSSGDGENDSASDCPALDRQGKEIDAVRSAEASRFFAARTAGLFAEENLQYIPGKGAKAVALVRHGLQHCHQVTMGDTPMTLTLTAAPAVPGSDETLGITATAVAAGQQFSMGIFIARRADTVVMVMCGGLVDRAQSLSATRLLLDKAFAKAKPVLAGAGTAGGGTAA